MRELLGVSESQVDRAVAAGEIPGVFRLGRLAYLAHFRAENSHF